MPENFWFALEPQARERCLTEASVMPGGPTHLIKGLGIDAGRRRDWNPLVWGIGGAGWLAATSARNSVGEERADGCLCLPEG